MDVFSLSRAWFDFSFENPEKIKPTHTALFFFAIEHCNRLGWKEKFGLPTQMAMDAIGIKNWRTYSSAFEEIVNWGFFRVYERSKNQYSATVIGIVNNTKATTKATTKALSKAIQKHSQKQSKSIAVIDIPINQKPINILTNKKCLMRNSEIFDYNIFYQKIDEKYKKYDLEYYHAAILNWSDSKGKMAIDWIATIRGAILRDEKEGKAKMATIVKSTNPYNEYLKPEYR